MESFSWNRKALQVCLLPPGFPPTRRRRWSVPRILVKSWSFWVQLCVPANECLAGAKLPSILGVLPYGWRLAIINSCAYGSTFLSINYSSQVVFFFRSFVGCLIKDSQLCSTPNLISNRVAGDVKLNFSFSRVLGWWKGTHCQRGLVSYMMVDARACNREAIWKILFSKNKKSKIPAC